MIEFALTVVFWALVLLGAATTVVWIAVAVILGVVETRRAQRDGPATESSEREDPLSVFSEASSLTPGH
ncbi:MULTISPECIES: hypothetical protein [unclassified Microbacterium]|uniref:hypothetical protein n=1 Tax=unclassified Microbacterium TaxID=2609290 RepID=UPI0034474215